MLTRAHDERQVSDRRYLFEESMPLLNDNPTDDQQEGLDTPGVVDQTLPAAA